VTGRREGIRLREVAASREGAVKRLWCPSEPASVLRKALDGIPGLGTSRRGRLWRCARSLGPFSRLPAPRRSTMLHRPMVDPTMPVRFYPVADWCR